MAMTAENIAALLKQHAGALELFAAQWTRCPADAVQEAFIDLAGQKQAPDNPRAWLYKVVRRKAMNAARAATRRQRHEQHTAANTKDWFSANTTTQLEVDETVAALSELPIEQREIIVARIWGGLSFREIAELTETSNSTCHRLYTDGIETLRKRLEPPCPTKATTQKA